MLKQLEEIESRIQNFEKEQEKNDMEIITTYEKMQAFSSKQTLEERRDEVLVVFFNIHNNMHENKKFDTTTKKQLLNKIESRVKGLYKMIQRLRIEEELEELKRNRDKVKSDLSNLNQQSKFGFHKK